MLYLLIFFPVFTHEINMPFVGHRGTKTPMTVTQKHSAFALEKSHLLNLKNVSGTTLFILLIGCYYAIYLTLDKIQTRTLVHPHKLNHYVYDGFFLYFLSLCFQYFSLISSSITFTLYVGKVKFPLLLQDSHPSLYGTKTYHLYISDQF